MEGQAPKNGLYKLNHSLSNVALFSGFEIKIDIPNLRFQDSLTKNIVKTTFQRPNKKKICVLLGKRDGHNKVLVKKYQVYLLAFIHINRTSDIRLSFQYSASYSVVSFLPLAELLSFDCCSKIAFQWLTFLITVKNKGIVTQIVFLHNL